MSIAWSGAVYTTAFGLAFMVTTLVPRRRFCMNNRYNSLRLYERYSALLVFSYWVARRS